MRLQSDSMINKHVVNHDPFSGTTNNVSSQSPVTIADGVDNSPTEYIFSYGTGPPISVTTGSTLQCTNSSCQHTFRVTSSQVQQYTVTVAARNVVGMGTASTPVSVGMLEVPSTTSTTKIMGY